MINLLPEESKRDIRAARMNVTLLQYNLIMLIALAALVLMCGLFYFILHMSQSTAIAKSNDNTAQAATYNDVRTQTEAYKNNLAVANKILGSEVNYTDEIIAITKLLPSGVLLDGITLGTADAGKQVSFSVHASSYDTAAALKANFQNSTLFSNVYFQNITDTRPSTTAEYANYPFQVTLSAKMNGSSH